MNRDDDDDRHDATYFNVMMTMNADEQAMMNAMIINVAMHHTRPITSTMNSTMNVSTSTVSYGH
jgi:hypothetical protein